MIDKLGVLVMAYGSPNNLEEIEPFYTDIRRGRKPSPELLHELTERYKAIGGKSPLLEVTNQQANSLQSLLGEGYKVYVGMRHWTPWIYEAISEMKRDGINKAVGIVMAPHYSGMSVAKYIEQVALGQEKNQSNIDFKFVTSWHNHKLLIEAFIEKIKVVQKEFEQVSNIHYLFTAHSLPEKILQSGDPYKEQLLETSQLIAKNLGINQWSFAFQSAGRTEDKWLGPDILEEVEFLHNEGVQNVLVCSIGFLINHLEVVYDIDIEAKQKADELGLTLLRADTLNNHPNLAILFNELILEKFSEF